MVSLLHSSTLSVTQLQKKLYEVIKELVDDKDSEVRPLLRNNQVVGYLVNPVFMEQVKEMCEELDALEDLEVYARVKDRDKGKKPIPFKNILSKMSDGA
jgi:hypothetical protein